MGIHERVRRLTLAMLCGCCLLVGGGAALTPGSALALVECRATTGAGSTLQSIFQQTLIPDFEANPKECKAAPKIEYNKTTGIGSGQGLEEWGLQGAGVGTLHPKLSANGKKLDGFIGTDDPPTKAEIEQSKLASGGAYAITIPVVSAPIAVIFHRPENCEIKVKENEFQVTNQELDLLYRHQQTWTQLVEQMGGVSSGAGCSLKPVVEVRSDNSGTSFAFKQYESQIKTSIWTKFVKDDTKWPEETQMKTTHGNGVENKGSKGEALAVNETSNSIGYVNTGDAAANGFGPWNTTTNNKLFWGRIQNNGLEPKATDAEPIKKVEGKAVGNCQTGVYTFANKGLEESVKKQPPVWEGIELANISTPSFYPLCTFTYDLVWGQYTAKNLLGSAEELYGTKGEAEEIFHSVHEYLTFLLGEGQTLVGKGTPEYYAPLPTNIQTIAKETLVNEVTS